MVLTNLGLIVFLLATQFGSTGLYEHNYEPFFELEVGDTLIYDSEYTIVAVWEYQALDPYNPYSDFYGYGRTLTVEQMFEQVYSHPGTLVLQTCIEKDGNLAWGRLFVVAAPIEREALWK